MEKQQWKEKPMFVTIKETRRVMITEDLGHVVIILKAQFSHSDHTLIHTELTLALQQSVCMPIKLGISRLKQQVLRPAVY